MNNTFRVVASFLVIALAVPVICAAADNYLLYAPGPSEGKRPSGPDEGVLVKRITIEKGDTLYSLSRRYGGKGTYFPQILLFNEIRNPDLIYAGSKLLVPLHPESGKGGAGVPHARADSGQKPEKPQRTGKESRPVTSPSRSEGTPEMRKEQPALQAPPLTPKQKPAVAAPKPVAETVQSAAMPKKSEETEQSLYEKGVTTYKSGAYEQSIEHFDRFLARYPASPLVPDATLYRADAFLRLAGQ